MSHPFFHPVGVCCLLIADGGSEVRFIVAAIS
jgi:hypothetical protein